MRILARQQRSNSARGSSCSLDLNGIVHTRIPDAYLGMLC